MEVFEGIYGKVTLLEDRIVIEKKLLGQESSTTIFLRDLIGVQYVRWSRLESGWLEFVTAGNFSNVDTNRLITSRANVIQLQYDKKRRDGEERAREEALRFKQLVEDAALALKSAH